MSFTPVLFANLSKSVDDLFDKKFDVEKHTVTLTTKAENNLTWVSTNTLTSALTSELTLKHSNAKFGSFEGKGSTAGALSAKAKFDKLTKGLVLELNAADKKEGLSGSLEAQYRKDFYALSAIAKLAEKERSLASTATIGFDGVSVGAQVAADLLANKVTLSDYNGAFQYKQNDLAVTVATTKKVENVKLSVHHQVSPVVQFAAAAQFNFDTQAKTLAVGGKYDVDALTSVKAKLANTGKLSTLFEHKVRPFAKVGVASIVDVTGAAKPSFGVSLSLGELDD